VIPPEHAKPPRGSARGLSRAWEGVRLWVDGAHAPAENMARDRALLAAASDPGFAPVLRLFRFAPHGITLGHAQAPERELDLGRCRRDGVPWAVRPTGGRAIFHAEEWTYSLATPLAVAAGAGTLADLHRRVAELIVASLVDLGVEARLAPAAAGRSPAPRPRDLGGAAPPCFASTSRHEIVRAGRKLVGSAQRRTASAALQQGSVLLGEGHLRLADYAAVPDAARPALRAALAAATAHAGDRVGPDAPLERWAASLVAHLPAGTTRLDGVEGLDLLARAVG
jgi:lipoate-protein ligase A